MSVHWLDFFTPSKSLGERVAALRALIMAKHANPEVTFQKNTQIVVVDIGKLHSESRAVEGIDGAKTAATAYHQPRFCGDSHSAIYPSPGVREWPKDNDAYHFALQKLLADCSESPVYKAIA